MTQVEFLRLWVRMKPAQVKRRTWHYLGMRTHAHLGAIGFAFREPRLWWHFQRIRLHVWFGFPLPPKLPYAIAA